VRSPTEGAGQPAQLDGRGAQGAPTSVAEAGNGARQRSRVQLDGEGLALAGTAAVMMPLRRNLADKLASSTRSLSMRSQLVLGCVLGCVTDRG